MTTQAEYQALVDQITIKCSKEINDRFVGPPPPLDVLEVAVRVTLAEAYRRLDPTDIMAQAAFEDGWVASMTDYEDFQRWFRAMLNASPLAPPKDKSL